MYRKFCVCVICIALASCTTYHGLAPLSPDRVATTAEISPYFKWKPSDKKSVKYDFIIYAVSWKGDTALPGESIYYKEGLNNPEHKIDFKLELGKSYLWAVRVRDGDTVEAWSKFDFSAYYIFGYAQLRNHLYLLEVISKNEKSAEF
ncbi:hypothetical protein MNBD_GAMMA11-2176 [hydrothermal vent metagenome]|uniref:Fibronectin type-III domain-containing protein n=1 Tax=hydrothermal vent metagenome TaxID=652676 RepID=A0A3B0XDM8_9ZZZZ